MTNINDSMASSLDTNNFSGFKRVDASDRFLEEVAKQEERALMVAQQTVQVLSKGGMGMTEGNNDPTAVQRMIMDSMMMVQTAKGQKLAFQQARRQEEQAVLGNLAAAGDLIGKSVEIACKAFTHKAPDQKHDIKYNMPDNMLDAKITIRNNSGTIIFQKDLDNKGGEYITYTWDGKRQVRGEDGSIASEEAADAGTYKIEITGTTAFGEDITMPAYMNQQITEVERDKRSIYAKAGQTTLDLFDPIGHIKLLHEASLAA